MRKLIVCSLLLSGCASTLPVVDRPNENYGRDFHECRVIANSRTGALEGAIDGALGGALLGSIVGYGSSHRSMYVAAGARGGAVGGATATHVDRQTVIKNCLRGRGHNVLN